MHRKNVVPFVVLVCFSSLALPALGQEFTRTELGIASSTLVNNRFATATETGISGLFTYNLSPSLAIDSEISSYFDRPTPILSQFGGRAAMVVAGPKAGVRRNRFGLFFKARPGFLTFSNAITSQSIQGTFMTGRKTHAAMDLGLVAEYYASRHMTLRLDIGELLVRYGDSTAFLVPLSNGLNAVVRSQGAIANPLHVSLAASYTMGRLRTEDESSSGMHPLQVGAQYSLQTLQRSFFTVRDESAGGAWVTYNFTRHFGLDAAANFFPRLQRVADFQQGGRMIQALAGVRWGIVRDNWGVFFKFRPGIQMYTITAGFDFRNGLDPHHFANLAFDTGGIFEIYTSRHTLLRFDAGDTTIHFRTRHFLDDNGNPFTVSGTTQSSIQATAGFGLRF